MSAVVITGGCGFIGSRLAIDLRGHGDDVRVIDVAPPPRDLPAACCQRRDITSPAALAGAFAGARVVVHAAAWLRRLCDEDPVRGWAVNAEGTGHVLAEAERAGVSRVIFLSTGGVYDATTYPIGEPTAVASRDLYTASKLAGEAMLAAAAARAGLSAVVLRLFTVYGPGPASGARGHFIAGWVERVLAGEPLVVHGDGDQTVDATHVCDVVAAIRRAMDAPVAPGACAIYNIGSGCETSVQAIASYLREVDDAIAVTHQPRAATTPVRQFADIQRARAELGYAPTVEPRLGIQALLRDRRAAEAR